jgi:hypothetical protein
MPRIGAHLCSALVLVLTLMAAACGALAAKPSACDGLVYKKGGPSRAEYLPCAGEMMAILDRLAPQIDKMIGGDDGVRSEASAGVNELRSLLKKAGGRNLLERWDDSALTSLNVDIWNTFTHHEACMMVAGQLFGRPPLGDEKNREPARSECRAYRGPYEDANREYRRLR